MKYIKTETLEVFSLETLQGLFPNMSIPEGADLSDKGFELVLSSAKPILIGNQFVIPGPVELVNGAWSETWIVETPTPLTIDEAKILKNEEINQARLFANFTFFTHAGKDFACDALSRSDIDATNGFITLFGTMPPGWPGGWKAIDNSYIAISTIDQWKSFYGSMFMAGAMNFGKSQGLKNALASATTLEQINTISW